MKARKIVLQSLLIILMSAVLGATVNFGLLRRFLAGEFRQGFIDTQEYAGIRFITLAEGEDLFARSLQAGEGIVFLDSRSGQDFASGHIPGARSVPFAELKGKENIASGGGLSGRLTFLKDDILVVYCEGGDCQTSLSLARAIHDLGFTDIRVLAGGWEEWTAARLPVEESR